MPPPPIGAIVNSTLALLSLVATGDFAGLMPYQIAIHPMAAQFLDLVSIEEAYKAGSRWRWVRSSEATRSSPR